jgi:hydroxymethylbilane synthase
MRQAELVAQELRRCLPAVALEIVVIQTDGDRAPDVPLEELEGTGFFAKALENALLEEKCDLAVHSAKDLPTDVHLDLCLAAFPCRADPRDVMIARAGRGLTSLSPGARVATSSLRRRAQLLHQRPDLQIVSIRGNIDTRLAKLDRGDCDALLLAGAGLLRMGWDGRVTEWLSADVMLPAPGQGAMAIEVRSRDKNVIASLSAIDHHATRAAVEAERAFVARLGSGCRAPAAALAYVEGHTLVLDGMIARVDGSIIRRHRARGPAAAPADLGRGVAEHLLAHAGFALEMARSGTRAEHAAIAEISYGRPSRDRGGPEP